ncbi:MAG: hypothetical protein HY231_19475 [Acidobacteria bacterium]|nr:hypothetical protein [Acidobacteriota bacterium]
MKKTLMLLSLIFALLSFCIEGQAQKPTKMGDEVQTKPDAKPASPFALPAELVEFYVGTWEGKGKFANGKPIEADVTYTTELDNQWLVFHHADRPPIQFKAVGTVGIDRESKKLVMLMTDSYSSAKVFVSDGWKDGTAVFTKIPMLAPITRHERFIFKRETPMTYKMTYEFSSDGTNWQMSDYMIFTKMQSAHK